jgi:hypothetical protein
MRKWVLVLGAAVQVVVFLTLHTPVRWANLVTAVALLVLAWWTRPKP